jgi:hypothetical protein
MRLPVGGAFGMVGGECGQVAGFLERAEMALELNE